MTRFKKKHLYFLGFFLNWLERKRRGESLRVFGWQQQPHPSLGSLLPFFLLLREKKTGGKFESFWMVAGAAAAASSCLPCWLTIAIFVLAFNWLEKKEGRKVGKLLDGSSSSSLPHPASPGSQYFLGFFLNRLERKSLPKIAKPVACHRS